jgi:hypothetical protein
MLVFTDLPLKAMGRKTPKEHSMRQTMQRMLLLSALVLPRLAERGRRFPTQE